MNAQSNRDARQLLADIGGTNVRFALYAQGALHEYREYQCRDYPSLHAAATAYLAQIDGTLTRPREAAFAVAAPLTGDHVSMTNHPWEFSVAALRAQLQLQRLFVLNDFTALAMSVPLLPQNELEQVGGGSPIVDAPIALLGPGTGLGVSGLIRSDEHWLPLQGYGGHVTMSASTDREAAVLAALRKQFAHVSAERVLSGSGLVLLYETLCALDDVTSQSLQPAQVTAYALEKKDERCSEAVRMFCAMLGTIASDIAVTLGAQGGVYIGGGIVPRLGKYFAVSEFRQRFEAKGRYASYLTPIPAYVIRSKTPALLGLARTFSAPAPRIESRV